MLNTAILVVFYFIILIYSIILHEVAHGVMASWLGDKTAKHAGRISANPVKHVDPWMTIMVPLFMYIISAGHFAFGGAKPVPYNPYNLRDQKWGPALVALAGPLSNILIAIVFALIGKFIAIPMAAKIDIVSNLGQWSNITPVIAGSLGSIIFVLCAMVIFWNVLLAIFNLIPIPPLDGSKLLFAVLPVKIETMAMLEQFGLIFLLLVVFVFRGPLSLILDFFWSLFFSLAI